MRLGALATALLLGCCAVPRPSAEGGGDPLELAGRSAGPAQRCVTLNQLDALRLSDNDPHTLVYGNGRTIWVNRRDQCRFRRDDVLVTEPTGSQLCGGDIVRSFDRNSVIPGPSCVLGDFIPYTR